MATALITPRWIQSIRYGAQPVLMTCPPRADGRPSSLAVGPDEVVADAAQVVGGELPRQGVEPVGDGRGGSTGRPRSSTKTLHGRDCRS